MVRAQDLLLCIVQVEILYNFGICNTNKNEKIVIAYTNLVKINTTEMV